jgi:hypothetical protein
METVLGEQDIVQKASMSSQKYRNEVSPQKHPDVSHAQ